MYIERDIHMCIYIYRERENVCVYIYIYMMYEYIYIYTHTDIHTIPTTPTVILRPEARTAIVTANAIPRLSERREMGCDQSTVMKLILIDISINNY